MESLAALSLASNVVQFVDFACRCFSSGKELYRSTDGATEEQLELADLTTKLQNLAVGLETDAEHLPPSLVAVAGESRKLASELLGKLDREKIKAMNSTGKKRKRDVTVQVVKNMWNKKDRDALATRLADLRSHLVVELLVFSKSSSLSEGLGLHNDLSINSQSENREILQMLQIPEALERLQASINMQNSANVDLGLVQLCLKDVLQGEEKLREAKQVLHTLRFPTLCRRQDSINDAYRNTYNWVIEPDKSKGPKAAAFYRWLAEDNGIFWVTGKPGSGKSTLMKFLSQCARSGKIFTEALDKQRIIVLDFYFWKAGSKDQRTQQGLLKTLVYQICKALPELVCEAVPEVLGSITNMDSADWKLANLRETIRSIILRAINTTRFCFFIDGLDEYDNTGSNNYHDLANYIQTLATFQNVKICISSRPYNVFKKYFGQRSELIMQLHDLTAHDIASYVQQRFKVHPKYDEVFSEHPYYLKLEREIVRRAKGVFLWVVLVVKSLLEGLDGDDSASMLQKRLENTPKELEDLFRQMLDSTDQMYREDAVIIYRSLLESILEPPALLLGVSLNKLLASKLENDVGFNKAVETSTTLLNARCKDLLCTDMILNMRPSRRRLKMSLVQFIHGSIYDFMKDFDWEAALLEGGRLVFEPLLHFLTACGFIIKSLKYEADVTVAMLRLVDLYGDVLVRQSPQYASTGLSTLRSISNENRHGVVHSTYFAPRVSAAIDTMQLDLINLRRQWLVESGGYPDATHWSDEELINGKRVGTKKYT